MNALKQYGNLFSPFLMGGEEKMIMTYGVQAQGIILKLTSLALNANIVVKTIFQKQRKLGEEMFEPEERKVIKSTSNDEVKKLEI